MPSIYRKVPTVDKPGELTVHKNEVGLIADEDLPPGHALVRVTYVGVCGTDFHAYHGRQPFFTYPRVLGHEIVGEVVRSTSDSGGRLVVVVPYVPGCVPTSDSCPACRRSRPNCCANVSVFGVHQDGALSGFLVVPYTCLVFCDNIKARVMNPVDIPSSLLAAVEPLAIARHSVSRALSVLTPSLTDACVVIGCGPIGLAACLFASISFRHVIAVDVDSRRAALAVDKAGATCFIELPRDASGDCLGELVRDATGGTGAAVVIDATGFANSMAAAVTAVAPGGVLVYVGLTKSPVPVVHQDAHKRELTLLCSRNATREDFSEVLASLYAGVVKIDGWFVTHVVSSPEEFVTQLPRWCDPAAGVIKAIVDLTSPAWVADL